MLSDEFRTAEVSMVMVGARGRRAGPFGIDIPPPEGCGCDDSSDILHLLDINEASQAFDQIQAEAVACLVDADGKVKCCQLCIQDIFRPDVRNSCLTIEAR